MYNNCYYGCFKAKLLPGRKPKIRTSNNKQYYIMKLTIQKSISGVSARPVLRLDRVLVNISCCNLVYFSFSNRKIQKHGSATNYTYVRTKETGIRIGSAE